MNQTDLSAGKMRKGNIGGFTLNADARQRGANIAFVNEVPRLNEFH